jgi:hypothetical protein
MIPTRSRSARSSSFQLAGDPDDVDAAVRPLLLRITIVPRKVWMGFKRCRSSLGSFLMPASRLADSEGGPRQAPRKSG